MNKPLRRNGRVDAAQVERKPEGARVTRRSRRRQPLVVDGDLPRFDAVASWERELLLPLVTPLIRALFDEVDGDEAPNSAVASEQIEPARSARTVNDESTDK